MPERVVRKVLVTGVPGLFVLLEFDVILEGVEDRGISGAGLRPVIDILRPRLATDFGDA